MNHTIELSSEDRQFFSLVSQAVFANPFSAQRELMDDRIVGMQGTSSVEESKRVRLLVDQLAPRLEKLHARGQADIRNYNATDRPLIEYSWLFLIYHQYLHRVDQLIRDQVKKGAQPLPVPFAKEVLEKLRRQGFTVEQSLRYFELFNQLRRAFYFIQHSLIGCSPSMCKLRRRLWNNNFTHQIAMYDRHLWRRMEDFSTLLLGETGTGKGTAAAAIGRAGYIPFNETRGCFEESFTSTFLSINLSQYTESLIESELFGHRKGSFTGAVDDHQGVFARSSRHGALFLDEIGEVSVPVQIKLLQVLQERTFSAVGSHKTQKFEGRVIAATNAAIDTLRSRGHFRDDFFYRLSSDIITVPPLRQRIAEDRRELDDLIALTVQRIIGQPSEELTAHIKKSLTKTLPEDYPWPGNVRELEQAVRRILLTGSYQGDQKPTGADPVKQLAIDMDSGTLEAKDLMTRYCRILYDRYGSYEEVARRTELDRRTVKKYIQTR